MIPLKITAFLLTISYLAYAGNGVINYTSNMHDRYVIQQSGYVPMDVASN